MNDDYFKANKSLWDEYAQIHYDSDNYSVKEFLSGETTLKSYELKELGDVKGKNLLHLQCHFGLDTLSWAREGAIVTGVDFSDVGIRIARSLAKEVNLDANFICSNIYDLPDALEGKFDIVYTSIGVICWLPDLFKWAKIISHFLKPGGIFYFAEIHPFSMVFDECAETELTIKYDYFTTSEPLKFDIEGGTYAVPDAKLDSKESFEWQHSLSEIINALLQAGLHLEFFNEYPYTCYQAFPFAEKEDDGYFYLKNQKAQIPLLFTLKATKL
ncbi:MAG: methyltransferase domain-containing protein [Asgard group archaeon]|nr:methyltransferase domain-containing protein [Asgard group archaeon]